MTVRMKELEQPVQTSALARALSELGDLILVAPPGMGKTSTLLQVAEGLVAKAKRPSSCRSRIGLPKTNRCLTQSAPLDLSWESNGG